ncbi:hypothetical protein [Streptomyces sp. NPDC052107]|uniref:hypothetical protein n=1 Tax=Streptomyces sp. NPDC052107 TaxID=3155632 RepID=UPI003415D3D3
MTSYTLPVPSRPATAEPNTVYTVASGDLRPAANVTCWPTQEKLEKDLAAALTDLGRQVSRGHAFDAAKGHGFIDSQRAGIEVFKTLPKDAPLIVVATAIELPEEETRRPLDATTPQWPIMHAVLHGVSRDQFMARHRANHLNVAYAPDAETADKALRAKAALFAELGVDVHLCGDVAL